MSQDPKGDYESALKLKEAGNEAFKQKDFKLALKKYSRIFMYLGMNPCMNLSAMTGGDPNTAQTKTKDPLETKTDELRLTAFNNIAAVYAKMGQWEDCKEKCNSVLKHDSDNKKALFRRAKSYRHLGLFDLARSDLNKLSELMGNDKALQLELKLLKNEEKKAEKIYLQSMKKAMNKARKKQKRKEAKKKQKLKEKAEKEKLELNNNNNNNSNTNNNETSNQTTNVTTNVTNVSNESKENKTESNLNESNKPNESNENTNNNNSSNNTNTNTNETEIETNNKSSETTENTENVNEPSKPTETTTIVEDSKDESVNVNVNVPQTENTTETEEVVQF